MTLAGHEVDVICLRRPGEPRREVSGKVTAHRVAIPLRRGGHLNYVLQYGVFFLTACVMVGILHIRRRFDVVQVNTMPDALVFAAVIPRLLGARVMLDLQESMPEFYAVKFGKGLGHPAVRLVAAVEQLAIRFADHAITCTDQMREAMASRGAPAHKIDVIMNSANEDEFAPGGDPRPARTPGEFTLICHGTVEPIFGIDTIVRAVALLRDEIPGLRLDVYGEGSALADLRALVRQLRLTDRVNFSGRFVAIDELVRAIAAADVGVVAVRRDMFRDISHCNKMFDFITMRKPAIVSRTRSVEACFDDSCFRMFTAGDERDLARAISELHADPDLRERMVLNATQANEPYRWPHQRARYQEAVQRLLNGPTRIEAARATQVGPQTER
jgi:glycosyltransferase involved in cell wall biosynthesis